MSTLDNLLDPWLRAADAALRTLLAPPSASRPCPVPAVPAVPAAATAPASELSAPDKALSGALMRVNHVGEVCAQALYTAQALGTRNAALREHFLAASRQETDHLAWTQQRLKALGARASWLNPLWYAGAFALGYGASRFGDAVSLGFVVETERQVEAHLASHLERLPQADQASRAVVAHMQADEAQHALDAEQAGAQPLPAPVQTLMRAAARVMTTTAHYL